MHFVVVIALVLIIGQGESTIYNCSTQASCGCSSSSTVLTRIIGGESAMEGAWLWTASLRFYGSHLCGASIISSQYLVTAAHCFEDVSDISVLSILAGSSTVVPSLTNKLYQIRSIAQVYIHPAYDSTLYLNDVAILQLSTPLNMADGSVKTICLPSGTVFLPPDNINLVAVGWGVTTEGDTTPAPTLYQVTVQSIVATAANCLSVIQNSTVQFCAGITAGGKDTCQGDSGGPLMAFVDDHWELDGITSNGYGCALAGYAGLYTRVSEFVPWITSFLPSDRAAEIKIAHTSTISSTSSTTKKPIKTTKTTTTKRRMITTTTTTLRPPLNGNSIGQKAIKGGINNVIKTSARPLSASIKLFTTHPRIHTVPIKATA